MFALRKLVQRRNNIALNSCDLSSLMRDSEASDFIKRKPNDFKKNIENLNSLVPRVFSLPRDKRENPGNEVES